MATEKVTPKKVQIRVIYVLTIIFIISMAIMGLWSLNADYVLLVRDLAIDHIKRYHPETVDLLIHLVWSGGRNGTGAPINSEQYIYNSEGWIIKVTYSFTLNPVYEIQADYSSTRANVIGVPTRIIWEGIFNNDVITEKSYAIAQ